MRVLARSFLAACLLAAASCESDILDGLDGEPDVSSMRLVIGAQAITINSSGTVTGGPITIGAGSTVSVSASFLTSEGTPDPNVTQASFQLNVGSSGLVTFQRNNVNPFAGTLSTSQVGNTQLSFALYDIESQRNEFGPFSVQTVIN